MLLSAHIFSFRSCRDVFLENVGAMLILLGRNGMGKTNVLLALEWAAKAASSINAEVDSYSGQLGHVKLELMIQGRHFCYEINRTVESGTNNGTPTLNDILRESLKVKLDNGTYDSVFERNGPTVSYGIDGKLLKIAPLSPAAYAIASLAPNDPTTSVIIPVMRFLHGFLYLPLDTPSREAGDNTVIAESRYLNWVRDSSSETSEKQAVFQALHLFVSDYEKFSEFVALVGRKGMGLIEDLKITDFAVDNPASPEKQEKMKYFIFHWYPQQNGNLSRHIFGELSYGTRRLIRLFLAIFYQKGQVLLIEQPEDGIHAGLLHKVVPTLRSYCEGRQFLIASHSAEILNRVSPEEIRLVDMESSFTSVRGLSVDELAAAYEFMNEEGPLSTFLSIVQG